MWERGLRAMLIRREKKLAQTPQPQALERATWGGKSPSLQDHFVRLMGVPLYAFDSYSDLDFLQNLGSAIRHGDGVAARKVHQLCPKLWFNWISKIVSTGLCEHSSSKSGEALTNDAMSGKNEASVVYAIGN